ncbi:hypothetical protein MKX08_007745 [Trichoderma sp. CBMAI-0020]|nr:hypothetical protein MKX08_007745 [Trichoderma sp. CBMAI-0020]
MDDYTSDSDILYSDEDDLLNALAGDDYERRSQISSKHFKFLNKIENGEYNEPKLLEHEIMENVDLKLKGDNGSTILHVMVERWSSTIEAPFAAIMKTYPDLYLVEDDLKRTALEKTEDGTREGKNHVEYFATNFSEETVNLLRGEKSRIMEVLLKALRNIAAWETLLRQLGTKALEHKWDGNPLLHRIVAYIATCTRSDDQFSILLDVVKALLHHVPESITQMNHQNLSAYQLHKKLLDKERQRGEPAKPDSSLSKKSSLDNEKHITPEMLVLKKRPTNDWPSNEPPTNNQEDVENPSRIKRTRPSRIRARTKKVTFPDLKSRVNKALARCLQLELLRKVDPEDIPSLLYHRDEEVEFDLDLSEMAQGKGMEDQQSWGDIIQTIRSLPFGEILRFVRIPGYSTPNNAAPRMYPDRIISILKDLSEKGVKYIIRLEAGSDPDLAESDEAIINPPIIKIRVLNYNPTEGWLAALSGIKPTKVFETRQVWPERNERFPALIQQLRQDWADQLSRIGEIVSNFAGSSSSASIKIAMIGDGLARFTEHIAAGRSFIQDGESGFRSLKPFYLSSTNHGARMTEIILQACQNARLYVARVTDIGYGSSEPLLIRNIARAIDWAIAQKVEIIYMGVGFKWSESDSDDLQRLKRSLFEANAKKVPLLSPIIEKDIGTFLPSDLRDLLLQIAPARKSSGIQHNWESDEQDYDFMVPGEITLSGEQGLAYGGSIAVAFATGLAATLMLAAKLKNSQIEIRQAFGALSSRTRTRFVFLDELKVEEDKHETLNNLTRFFSERKLR